MTCHRCHGFLIVEIPPKAPFTMIRCVNCGDCYDNLVLTNRYMQRNIDAIFLSPDRTELESAH